MKAIRSVIACMAMGLSAYFGSITMQCVHLWMAVMIPRTWRWYIDLTMYMWISSTVWLMEWIIGIRFRLFGDEINPNDRAIFIMNHRTRLDWLYFYGILMRYGWSVSDEKIVLKHELKRLPGAGWAMQCGSYMFLRRNLQRDKFYLSNMLEYFCSLGHKTKILLFPEGTDLNPSSLEKSHKFADKTAVQRYKNVLHPRTSGFVHLVQEAIRFSKANGESLDAIYNVTVAYPDENFATNELGFLLGRSASEGHFQCQRFPLSEVLGDSEAASEEQQACVLRAFVTDKWREKEAVLGEYYEAGGPTRQLPGPEVSLATMVPAQWLSVVAILGNMLLCVAGLLLAPRVFMPVLLILNGLFIYVDVFQHGVDDLVMRLALCDRYRRFMASGKSEHPAKED